MALDAVPERHLTRGDTTPSVVPSTVNAMTPDKPEARLLVVDLDDTLWTWFEPWHAAFSALLRELVKLSGVDEAELRRAIRPIHQRHGTSEYSWLLDELEILTPAVPDGISFQDYYDPALHAQNKARKAATQLYPTVLESLQKLQHIGTTVVAFTESLAFWTDRRVQQTGLDGLITEIYSSPDHDSPKFVDVQSRRLYDSDTYELKQTRRRHLPIGTTKPNPRVLGEIISNYRVEVGETVYIGDSLMKDVAMAQSAGAIDALAVYGSKFADPRYELLQSVSHWSDAAISQEQDRERQPRPSIRLDQFVEIFSHVNFRPTDKD